MSTSTRVLALGAALGFAALAPMAEGKFVASLQGSLAGSWIVNPDESEDPQAKIETALSRSRGGSAVVVVRKSSSQIRTSSSRA